MDTFATTHVLLVECRYPLDMNNLYFYHEQVQQLGEDDESAATKKRRRRASKRGRDEKILPDSILEALSLSNGKIFYIVTSPKEHGFNPESTVFSSQAPADGKFNMLHFGYIA